MTGIHIYNGTFHTRRLDPDPSEDLQPHVHTVSPHRRISASLMALLSRAWLWVYGTYGLVDWLRRVPARDRPRRPPNRVISSYRESAARDGPMDPMDQFELAGVIKAFIWSKDTGSWERMLILLQRHRYQPLRRCTLVTYICSLVPKSALPYCCQIFRGTLATFAFRRGHACIHVHI